MSTRRLNTLLQNQQLRHNFAGLDFCQARQVSVHELSSLTEPKTTCTKRHPPAMINGLAAHGQRP